MGLMGPISMGPTAVMFVIVLVSVHNKSHDTPGILLSDWLNRSSGRCTCLKEEKSGTNNFGHFVYSRIGYESFIAK